MTGPDAREPLRLNRYLARAGVGSRRSVEELIAAGRVRVNDEIVREPGRRIAPGEDQVTLDGAPVALPVSWRVLAFHKPLGVVSSLRPQDHRPCLSDYRSRAGLSASLVPAGRLDADTSGLLLWTDDGDLAQALCRPSTHLWKRYAATLDAPLADYLRRSLTEGSLELDGRPCLPARLEATADDRRWILWLREGRNRQVRRMFACVGRRVVVLHRTTVGPVELGDLPPGDFRPLTPSEEALLRRAVAATDSDPKGGA